MKTPEQTTGWRRPEIMLLVMAAGVPLSFSTWQTLLNNFAIERSAFTGAEIGVLQSLREIPGFLSLGVIALLWLLREHAIRLQERVQRVIERLAA